MEDQPADSGDLTARPAVPEGKSARRHRLPRQKLREGVNEEAAADAPVDAEPAIAESDVAEPDVAEPADPVDETTAAEPEPEPAVAESAPARRRRFPWRRGTADVSPAAAPVVDPPSDEVPETASETVEPDTASVDEPGTDVPRTDAPPEPEPVLVPHRTAGRGLKVAAVAAGVLFVGAAAFAGATVQPYLADRAEVHTKFEIAEISADAITTLWTYTPEDMDTLPDRAAKYLGGDFAADYRRYIDSIVEPNKQAQVSNATQVLGAAVESMTPTEATALVYTNSVATSPVTKGIPSLRYLSYRLSLERKGSEWLITRMTAVTSLDLTPRL